MGPCTWRPRRPFICSDNDNVTFAMVEGTFYWSIVLFAIRLNFMFQQTHDISQEEKNNRYTAVGYMLLVKQTYTIRVNSSRLT